MKCGGSDTRPQGASLTRLSAASRRAHRTVPRAPAGPGSPLLCPRPQLPRRGFLPACSPEPHSLAGPRGLACPGSALRGPRAGTQPGAKESEPPTALQFVRGFAAPTALLPNRAGQATVRAEWRPPWPGALLAAFRLSPSPRASSLLGRNKSTASLDSPEEQSWDQEPRMRTRRPYRLGGSAASPETEPGAPERPSALPACRPSTSRPPDAALPAAAAPSGPQKPPLRTRGLAPSLLPRPSHPCPGHPGLRGMAAKHRRQVTCHHSLGGMALTCLLGFPLPSTPVHDANERRPLRRPGVGTQGSVGSWCRPPSPPARTVRAACLLAPTHPRHTPFSHDRSPSPRPTLRRT